MSSVVLNVDGLISISCKCFLDFKCFAKEALCIIISHFSQYFLLESFNFLIKSLNNLFFSSCSIVKFFSLILSSFSLLINSLRFIFFLSR